jgi:hypothetical protein
VFNFESKSSYQVRVRATDVAGQNVFRDFAISVSDVNEVPTLVILSSTEIAENSTNLLVATLTTDDPDLNDPTTFALVSGAGGSDNGSFNIVGNRLFANSAFDFEAKSVYNIRIRATDSASNQVTNAFVVRVLDRNDSPTGVVLTHRVCRKTRVPIEW